MKNFLEDAVCSSRHIRFESLVKADLEDKLKQLGEAVSSKTR